MEKLKFRLICIVAFILSFSLPVLAGSVKLWVEQPRGQRNIGVNDLFYIHIEVKDINGSPQKPASLPGAKVVYFDRTGQSSRIVSVNGQTTQSFSYTYTLTARAVKEGSYSYGPISVDGVKSNSVNYSIGGAATVQNANSASGGNRNDVGVNADDTSDAPKYIGNGDANLFMRASINKSSAYEQEALVYTVKLYTTYDAIKFIGATATPKFEGFVVEESKDRSTSLSYENYNGKTYATAIIARYIIFPQMPGALKVLGNTYTVSVDKREYYHDPFWGNMSYATPMQLNVKPNDLAVDVKALPSPKPADFSGGVGTFTLTSQLPAADYKTNQAASIKYIIKGTGNLKYVTLPELNNVYPSELEVFSPTTDVKQQIGSNNVTGTVTLDYSFMPLEEGNFRIPDVKLVYFNPASGKYETTTAKGYDIKVGKGKASAKSQSKSRLRFNGDLMSVDESEISKSHEPWIYGFPYWLFYIIPVVLLCATYGYMRYYENQHSDMAAFNSKRADKYARRRLKKAYTCMRSGNTESFYDEMLNALWGYLGDKLKMPASELMRDNIKSMLAENGIGESTTEGMIGLIDDCEFAKYSSAKSKDSMEDIYSRAINVINAMQKEFEKA